MCSEKPPRKACMDCNKHQLRKRPCYSCMLFGLQCVDMVNFSNSNVHNSPGLTCYLVHASSQQDNSPPANQVPTAYKLPYQATLTKQHNNVNNTHLFKNFTIYHVFQDPFAFTYNLQQCNRSPNLLNEHIGLIVTQNILNIDYASDSVFHKLHINPPLLYLGQLFAPIYLKTFK